MQLSDDCLGTAQQYREAGETLTQANANQEEYIDLQEENIDVIAKSPRILAGSLLRSYCCFATLHTCSTERQKKCQILKERKI